MAQTETKYSSYLCTLISKYHAEYSEYRDHRAR
jgi:hypothetical protein